MSRDFNYYLAFYELGHTITSRGFDTGKFRALSPGSTLMELNALQKSQLKPAKYSIFVQKCQAILNNALVS